MCYCAINSPQIVNVYMDTGGFDDGYFVVEGLEQFAGKYLHVDFLNENVVAMTTKSPTVDKKRKPKPGAHRGGGHLLQSSRIRYSVSLHGGANVYLPSAVLVT